MKSFILPFILFPCLSCAFTRKKPLQNIPPKPVVVPAHCLEIDKIDALKPLGIIDAKNQADLILVSKTKKKVYVMKQQHVLVSFHAAFGDGYSDGNKVQEGDKRTPEGTYKISSKNPESQFHKGLQISYPNSADIAYAKKYNVSAGGDILLHGISNKFGSLANNKTFADTVNLNNWTAGCVAIRNDQIDLIYPFVKIGTTVEICPLE